MNTGEVKFAVGQQERLVALQNELHENHEIITGGLVKFLGETITTHINETWGKIVNKVKTGYWIKEERGLDILDSELKKLDTELLQMHDKLVGKEPTKYEDYHKFANEMGSNLATIKNIFLTVKPKFKSVKVEKEPGIKVRISEDKKYSDMKHVQHYINSITDLIVLKELEFTSEKIKELKKSGHQKRDFNEVEKNLKTLQNSVENWTPKGHLRPIFKEDREIHLKKITSLLDECKSGKDQIDRENFVSQLKESSELQVQKDANELSKIEIKIDKFKEQLDNIDFTEEKERFEKVEEEIKSFQTSIDKLVFNKKDTKYLNELKAQVSNLLERCKYIRAAGRLAILKEQYNEASKLHKEIGRNKGKIKSLKKVETDLKELQNSFKEIKIHDKNEVKYLDNLKDETASLLEKCDKVFSGSKGIYTESEMLHESQEKLKSLTKEFNHILRPQKEGFFWSSTFNFSNVKKELDVIGVKIESFKIQLKEWKEEFQNKHLELDETLKQLSNLSQRSKFKRAAAEFGITTEILIKAHKKNDLKLFEDVKTRLESIQKTFVKLAAKISEKDKKDFALIKDNIQKMLEECKEKLGE